MLGFISTPLFAISQAVAQPQKFAIFCYIFHYISIVFYWLRNNSSYRTIFVQPLSAALRVVISYQQKGSSVTYQQQGNIKFTVSNQLSCCIVSSAAAARSMCSFYSSPMFYTHSTLYLLSTVLVPCFLYGAQCYHLRHTIHNLFTLVKVFLTVQANVSGLLVIWCFSPPFCPTSFTHHAIWYQLLVALVQSGTFHTL